jgi:hypothetical protein
MKSQINYLPRLRQKDYMSQFLSEAEAQAQYLAATAKMSAPVPTFVQWLQANHIVLREIPSEKRPQWMK